MPQLRAVCFQRDVEVGGQHSVWEGWRVAVEGHGSGHGRGGCKRAVEGVRVWTNPRQVVKRLSSPRQRQIPRRVLALGLSVGPKRRTPRKTGIEELLFLKSERSGGDKEVKRQAGRQAANGVRADQASLRAVASLQKPCRR